MSHRSRFPSEVRMNAPLRVPTSTRTPLMVYSFMPVSDFRFPPSHYGILGTCRSTLNRSITRQSRDLDRRPNFHGTFFSRWNFRSDIHRLIEVLGLDEEIATELFV